MRKDTYPDTVLKTKGDLTRKGETRKDIMLTLQRMDDPSRKRVNQEVKTLQVMKNMF